MEHHRACARAQPCVAPQATRFALSVDCSKLCAYIAVGSDIAPGSWSVLSCFALRVDRLPFLIDDCPVVRFEAVGPEQLVHLHLVIFHVEFQGGDNASAHCDDILVVASVES